MFIVIEIQAGNAEASTLVNSYTDREQAESKYHFILSAAAVSEVPVHSAVMLTETGTRIKNECYIHSAEPEPEEEPVEE